MKDQVDTLEAAVLEQIAKAGSLEELQGTETAFLGKKGQVTALLKSLKDVPPEERKELGQSYNRLKQALSQAISDKKDELVEIAEAAALKLDITLPGTAPERGALHPCTQLTYELNDAFLSLGFEVYEGPEVTSEGYAFDNLNYPDDHPARESMDTYWLEGSQEGKGYDRLCLRPHLTGASVRYMQSHQPPFRFVYPGRVFRCESTDASHERAFNQYEALIVDKEVPFSAGKVMVNTILELVFGRKVETRMRAGFFSFVEPGFELDMQCLVCEGKGCSICKQVGWLEMMPGGSPHPNVLRAGGLNPKEWQGFYISFGLDRIAMMKHRIDDIRHFHSTDLRFLQQFNSARID